MTRMLTFFALLVAVVAAPVRGVADMWRAPAFTLRDLAGTPHSLTAYKGKVVVLSFFASWCQTCAASVSGLNTLAKRYPEKLVVLAVSTGEDDPHDLPAFVERHAPEYTVLVDETDRVGRQYHVLGFPTYYIIDAKGMVRASRDGAVEWADPRNRQKLEMLFETPELPASPMPITTVSLKPSLR